MTSDITNHGKPTSEHLAKVAADKERLDILKSLDIKRFNELMTKERGERASSDEVALVAMHKARYYLGVKGILEKKYMIDSRRWLVMNEYSLPEISH